MSSVVVVVVDYDCYCLGSSVSCTVAGWWARVMGDYSSWESSFVAVGCFAAVAVVVDYFVAADLAFFEPSVFEEKIITFLIVINFKFVIITCCCILTCDMGWLGICRPPMLPGV